MAASKGHRGSPIRVAYFSYPLGAFLESISTYISSVGNRASRLIRLNRTKGVVLCSGALLGQEIEKARLSHVRQTDASHFQVLANPSESNDIVLDSFNLLGGHGDCIGQAHMNTYRKA